MDGFLWAIFALVIIVAAIIVVWKIKQAALITMNKHSYEELVDNLKKENEHIKSELVVIKENLSSINKMMKEIE